MTNLSNLLKKNWPRIPRFLPLLFLVGGFIGFADSSYLSILHYQNIIPPCSVLGECETVLTSQYSVLWGVPTSLFGALYYLAVVVLSVLYFDTKRTEYIVAAMGVVIAGFVFTLWLVYLQAFVIKAFCEYCLLSAGTTTAMFTGAAVFIVVWTHHKSLK